MQYLQTVEITAPEKVFNGLLESGSLSSAFLAAAKQKPSYGLRTKDGNVTLRLSRLDFADLVGQNLVSGTLKDDFNNAIYNADKKDVSSYDIKMNKVWDRFHRLVGMKPEPLLHMEMSHQDPSGWKFTFRSVLPTP